jgi:hypothetical protein
MATVVNPATIPAIKKSFKALPEKPMGSVNIASRLDWAKALFLKVESSSVGAVAKKLNRSSTYVGRICRAYQYSLIPGVAKALNAGKLTWSKLMKIAESTKSRSAVLALI